VKLDQPVVALINADTLVEGFPTWWLPSSEALAAIGPGWWIKVRALVIEDDEGGDFWDSSSIWVSVIARSEDQLDCIVEEGGIDQPGFEDGDRVTTTTNRVFDLVEFGAEGEPLLNESRARSLKGKTVLIGTTSRRQDGSVSEQRQVVGTVKSIEPTYIRLRLTNGEHYDLPPDARTFEEARPGEYRLRSTGEIVVDPDFTSTWIVNLSTDRRLSRWGFRTRRRRRGT
jgi:hypothetical protein